MFFDNEKDIINENNEVQMSDSGAVSWEDVLSSDKDLLIEQPIESQPTSTVNLGDDLELVQDIDDVDNQELISILKNDEKTPQNNADEIITEDFDIDSKLENIAFESNKEDNENIKVIPRKEEKKSSKLNIILLAFLFACLVAYGVIYTLNHIKNIQSVTNSKINTGDIIQNQTPQQKMDNISKEELQERTKNNIQNTENEQEEKLQEDKQKKEDKKQIIKVIQTGRTNPFMPIDKYAQTSFPTVKLDFESSGVPKPPETFGIKEEETEKLMTVAVSGIMYDEIKPSAIITYDNNDYFVQEGDKLNKYKILDITRNYVVISYGNNSYKANIGEEFKLKDNIYGSAKFIPQNQGGGRQYYTVESENSSSNRSQYISEEEIEIKTK